jgi:hypothetical protein
VLTLLRAAAASAAAAVLVVGVLAPPSSAAPVVHVSGAGPIAQDDDCTDDPPYLDDNAPAGVPPLLFSGDLEGCYYVDEADTRVTAAGGGRFRLVERGTETFIGTLFGDPATFRTKYVFLAWFQGNPLENPDAKQLSGSCHHPLIEGGTGALHFTDDVDAGLIHYRGVLRLTP